MNWINVQSMQNPNSIIFKDYTSMSGPIMEIESRLKGHNQFLTVTSLKDYWPDMTKVLGVTRWSDVMTITGPGGYTSKFYYLLRSDVSDPLFWEQPLNMEWVEELKAMLGK